MGKKQELDALIDFKAASFDRLTFGQKHSRHIPEDAISDAASAIEKDRVDLAKRISRCLETLASTGFEIPPHWRNVSTCKLRFDEYGDGDGQPMIKIHCDDPPCQNLEIHDEIDACIRARQSRSD